MEMKNIGIFQIDTNFGRFTCNVFETEREQRAACWDLIVSHSLFVVEFLSFVVINVLLRSFILEYFIFFIKINNFHKIKQRNARKVFSKNITCKTSRNGVALENTNIFHFHVTQKLFKTYA